MSRWGRDVPPPVAASGDRAPRADRSESGASAARQDQVAAGPPQARARAAADDAALRSWSRRRNSLLHASAPASSPARTTEQGEQPPAWAAATSPDASPDASVAPGDAHGEPAAHRSGTGDRLNWLRAGVLGANDGIVSVAGIVLGVLGATREPGVLLTAGAAGLVAGALSMAAGEYVSVSTQRDTQTALLALERRELAQTPAQELEELTRAYQAKGLDRGLAHQVAVQLTARDALGAHADLELGLDPSAVARPWQAAGASLLAFTAGALLPLLAALLVPAGAKVLATAAAVLVALVATGALSARLGRAPVVRAVLRTTAGGAAAMVVTYTLGGLVGGLR